MKPADLLAALPPWLLLALTLGAAIGAGLKCLLPKHTPGLLASGALCAAGLAIGHLCAVVGELPSWQVGSLRLLPGLAACAVLVWLAKSGRL